MKKPPEGGFGFLVARGGINQSFKMSKSVSKLLNETLDITLDPIKRPQLPPPAQ
jgi:hypothetical protein